jgi:L-fucose isomerase-like protein
MSDTKEKDKAVGSPLLYTVELACGNMENSIMYASKQFETREAALLCAEAIKENGVNLTGTTTDKAGKPSAVMYIVDPNAVWSITVWGPDMDKETEVSHIHVNQFAIDKVVAINMGEE